MTEELITERLNEMGDRMTELVKRVRAFGLSNQQFDDLIVCYIDLLNLLQLVLADRK